MSLGSKPDFLPRPDHVRFAADIDQIADITPRRRRAICRLSAFAGSLEPSRTLTCPFSIRINQSSGKTLPVVQQIDNQSLTTRQFSNRNSQVRGFGLTDAPLAWILAGIIVFLIAHATGIISFFY